MNKRIKIIDIINIFANEEWDKLPKTIKYGTKTMYFDEEYLDYNYGENWFLEDFNFYHSLNEEVEIIEEYQPKTIEKFEFKKDDDNEEYIEVKNGDKMYRILDIEMAKKINWLIDRMENNE